jgi:hypothetical protein
MLRKILPLLVALIGLAGLTQGAAAADFFAFGRHDDDSIRVWKPYVIEKNCVDDFYHCRVRMDYAPFQRSMVVKPGSYWYQKPFKVYRYGDFKHRHRHHHLAHHHGGSRHVAWCLGRYRSYDPASNTFVGKGHKRYHCDSPYDRR